MVRIKQISNDKYGVEFSGDNFLECLDIVKEGGLFFDKKTKFWKGNKSKIFPTFLKLEQIEPVQIHNDLKMKLFPTVELKIGRNILDKDCLVSEPLADYQIDGIKEIINKNRFCLFDDCALGKTYMVLSALNHYHKKGQLKKIIILCPPEAKYNWVVELRTFSQFFNEDKLYMVNTKNRNPFIENVDIIIMSYRNFVMIHDDKYKQVTGKRSTKNCRSAVLEDDIKSWASGNQITVITDEQHFVKNFAARRTKVLMLYKNFFHRRYGLTATPFPNGIHELWSQFKYLDESVIPYGYYQWLSEIANIGNNFSNYSINYFYKDKVEGFLKRTRPYYLRRFIDNVLAHKMPERIEKRVYCPITKKQQSLYRDLIKYHLFKIKEEKGEILVKEVKNKFSLLSLALDNPSLLKGKFFDIPDNLKDKIEKWKFKDNSKWDNFNAIVKRVLTDDKEKLIICDFHPETLNELANIYEKYNPLILHGAIDEIDYRRDKDKYKFNIISEFRNNPGRNLLLINPTVLNTAVNIVECHNIVFFTRTYNYTVMYQFLRRVYRPGQKNKVKYYYMIIDKSLDVFLDKALKDKNYMNKTLLTKRTLNKFEWEKIFEGVV